VHANSARAGLYRLEQLIGEAAASVPRRLIAEAVDIVVHIAGRGPARRVESVAAVAGFDGDGDYRLAAVGPPALARTA